MATISIDFNSEKKEVYLLGDIKALKANRFAWRYMKDYLHPVEETDKLVVKLEDETPFVIMGKIRSMLEKYGFCEKRTETSEQILLDFYEHGEYCMQVEEDRLEIVDSLEEACRLGDLLVEDDFDSMALKILEEHCHYKSIPVNDQWSELKITWDDDNCEEEYHKLSEQAEKESIK